MNSTFVIRDPVITKLMRWCTALTVLVVLTAGSILQVAESAQDSAGQASMKKRPTYFPNTERLGSDEMRVTALGTGLPTPITRAQKSTAWMVELGNGDVFLFDIGTGSMENLFGLRPDFSKIDKIFLSHLHMENQLIYERNGVRITSWPAIHSLDGSVSYRLEWNGLSFVFGGDTRPNKWFIEYAKNADIAIHECFPTPEGLAAFNDWEMRPSTFVSSYIHTPPQGFGKVMSEIKPRMAIAFHTVLLPDIQQGMFEGIRKTYDGPLTIVNDLMVWNVTKDTITTREAVFPDRVRPPPTTQEYKTAPRSGEARMSEFIMGGVWKGFTPPPLPKE